MTFGVRRPSRIDAAIAPGTAFCFSLFIAFLAPHYTQWYGDAMPALTHRFIAVYPLWIAITAAGVVMQVFGTIIAPDGPARALWKTLDGVLAIASVLIIVVGIIALSLPIFLLQLPI